MFLSLIFLILSLVFILFVCAVFTNAVEWFGKERNLGHGITGSILAAVGTALPETIIPIIAIVFENDGRSDQIGIGAIAGAPFMLATLGFSITGLSVIIYSSLKKRKIRMNADPNVLIRDLTFFIIVYGIAIITTFVKKYTIIKISVPIVLLLFYLVYIGITFNSDRSCEPDAKIDEFYMTRFFEVKSNLFWIVFELLLALLGIVYGSHLFVKSVERASQYIGISPLILSMLITPIATELPEKLNSVIWIGKKKDTLALGNITGAMVFQCCFPVAFGIAFTTWDLTGITLLSAILAITSGFINLVWIRVKKSANPFVLLSGGAFYIIFLFYIIFG